ncbi:MAG: hypothetical protein QUS33_03610 [Dehalococcoidia bacterium]|nr:hypothetical protein [Dehalococcoidia bacterium]
MIRILKRLRQWRYSADAALMLVLVGFPLYLMRFLFDWNDRVLASDLSGAWGWFYWLKESLFTFHQLPTWSPLWLGGIPFFGIVPPAGFFLVFPFYLVTGDTPAAYNLGIIIMFSLAGLPMYAYLKHLSHNRLVSFLGASIYIVLPVHACSMVFWGHFEIICAYAVVPLMLLLTDYLLDGGKQIALMLLVLLVSFVLLLQIEFAFIFLLFYIPYLIFALAMRRIGLRSILALIKKNRTGVIIGLVILLIPVSFYITVIMQYGRFAGLTKEQIEGGLPVYTLKHFGDTFQERLPSGLRGFFGTPQMECYSGGCSFLILLASTASVVLEKGHRRAQLLFFLIAGVASLLLSMGIFGPLFPAIRAVLPFVSGMRVPLRFYYIFAVCLPILFALALPALGTRLARISTVSSSKRRLLLNGVPLLLVAVSVIDFSPSLDFYRHRVLDRDQYNVLSSFLEDRLEEDNLPADDPVRILIVPDGVEPDRLARLETTDSGQFTVEVSQSWLGWNQYEGASSYDFAVFTRILRSKQDLVFFSDLLSYDYVMRYEHKLPPAGTDSTYLDLMDQLVNTLDAFCEDEAPILTERGLLETDYYRVQLYRINKASVPNARFYSLDESLFMDNGDLYATMVLFDVYRALGDEVSSSTFLRNVVAIRGQKGLPETMLSGMASLGGVCTYGGESLLLPTDSVAAVLPESRDCDAKGWMQVKREGSPGFPDSGLNMAISDVMAVEDNYLDAPFTIEQEGMWSLNVAYYSDSGTGCLDLALDGASIATIDTNSPEPSMREYSIDPFLDAGPHVLRLMGRESHPVSSPHTPGDRVEVGRVSLLNLEQLPRLLSESQALWERIGSVIADDTLPGRISDFRLSPTGVSLDIHAAQPGIVSIAYYYNPWWKVYVDGREVSLLKVNGAFPGCYMASGQHHIAFVCKYPSLASIFSPRR